MKTLTVRDLRYDFGKVEAWLNDGQEIEITKYGKLVARISPPGPKDSPLFEAAAQVQEMREAELGDLSGSFTQTHPSSAHFTGLRENSELALAYRAAMSEPLHVTRLLIWEFRQSVRFQAFRHSKNPHVGGPLHEAEKMLADFSDDLRDRFVIIVEIDLMPTLITSEHISKLRTFSAGHRSFDLLHVATATDLHAREFLSFSANQNALATVEGLKTPLRSA